MPSKKTLRDLKVGDTVFVVWQQRTHSTTPQRTSTETVSKVGRKYATLRDNDRYRFSLDTGKSFHGEDTLNTRANGDGFDVYRDEEGYQQWQHDEAELARLQSRLTIGTWVNYLKPLSPEVVARIHDVLDNAENTQP